MKEKFNDRELLEIFPEAREIIPIKIKEWETELDVNERKLKEHLSLMYKKDLDNFSLWFWEQVAKTFLIPPIIKAEKNILRLKRMLVIHSSNRKKVERWQEKLEIARQFSVYDIANENLELKPLGDKFQALCPFHNEKHASFFIYISTNSFFCFGCGESGDVIKLTMHLYGIDFKEAVQMLQN